MSFIFIFCFAFSAMVSADETDNPGASKIIVDPVNNTITFIYNEDNIDLMEQWEALPHYSDVDDDAWYQMYISYLAQLGILDSSVSNFFPETPITRGEFTEMLFLSANGNTITQPGESSIEDGLDNNNSNTAVQWAITNNIISENINGFQAEDYITINEAFNMLFALAEYQNSSAFDHYISDIVMANAANNLESISENSYSDNTSPESNTMQIAENLIGSANTTDTLEKCEAAKILSFYIALNTHPDFIIGTNTLSYIESDPSYEEITMGTISDDDDNFHSVIALNALENMETVSPQWTSSTVNGTKISVHRELTNQGFYILFQDKSSSISNLTGKFSQTARNQIYAGSVAPDSDETSNKSAGHYCSPSLKNKYGSTSSTAYTNFNNHYYNAKLYYSWEEYLTAYNKLGRAIHYLEDINSPPHAALITGDNHSNYEVWVRDSINSSYYVTTAPSDTYSYMTTSTFKNISISFATYSNSVANDCVYNRNIAKTKECLKRCQRAVAGLAYRYLIDTGRNN